MTKYNTPIHQACLTGDTEQIIRMLKQNRRLVHARDHEDTPLHCAATEAVARLLVEWKADINARGWMGQTSLHVAASQGHADIVRLLIHHGADVNAQRTRGDTPLYWAANAVIAQILIENGAVLEAQDSFGARPLHWAARYARPDVVLLLLSRGADIHARNKRGETPFFTAVGSRIVHDRGNRMLVARYLLEAGADVNAQTEITGFTPLHEAIWCAGSAEGEDENMVRFLIDNGANIYNRNSQGQIPLHMAKNKPQLLAILTEYTERIGRPPALAPEQFVVEQVRTHPRRREAITLVENAILARWVLDNPPRLLTSTQTVHARFNAIAVSPDGEMIVVGPAEEPIEFRRWDDLSLLPDGAHSISDEATSLAFSPDGRWFALADPHESIYLIDRTSGDVTAEVEGGEWTSTLLFNPTSTILASACSFQGGGHIRLDRIGKEGQLIPVYEHHRSNITTLPHAFVDSLIHLAFSPDGHLLALFESSSIYYNQRPSGWRGNIVLYSVETGVLRWQTSVDAQVTGDRRSLKEVGYPMGFFTELLFVGNTEIACGATHGLVLFYDVASGRLIRSMALDTDAAVCSLSLDKDDKMLWVVLNDGKLALISL